MAFAMWRISHRWSASLFFSLSFSASVSSSVSAICRGRRSAWPTGVFFSMSWWSIAYYHLIFVNESHKWHTQNKSKQMHYFMIQANQGDFTASPNQCSNMCMYRPLLVDIHNANIYNNNNVITFLSTWRSKMNCGNLWIGFIIRPYKVILSLLVSWRCWAWGDMAVKVLLQGWFHKHTKILKAKTFVTWWTLLSNLKEFQEAGFGSTSFSHHGHCSAEVVHILTVGIQHHGLWKLLRKRDGWKQRTCMHTVSRECDLKSIWSHATEL